MQTTPHTTTRQTTCRAATAGSRRATHQLHGRGPGGWWRGLALLLLIGGGLTGAHAQTIEGNPNDIIGTINWNNPAGPVRSFLLDSLNPTTPSTIPGGFGSWFASANGGGFSASSGGYTAGTGVDGATTPYGIRVQGISHPSLGSVPGVVHTVSVTAGMGDGNYYYFTNRDSPTVFPMASPYNAPPVTLNFSECAGLLDIQFCDTNGALMQVYAAVSATIVSPPPTGLQAYGPYRTASEQWLAVRGGSPGAITYQVNATVLQSFGSDPYVNLITIPINLTTNVTVLCNETKLIRFCFDTNSIEPPKTNDLGKICGWFDVNCEYEHWIDRGTSLLIADDGPFGNYRYDSIEPACFPCPWPLVGTTADNSAGMFCLPNLLPSNSSTPARDYRVRGFAIYGTGRRFQAFDPPWLEGPNGRVTVPSGGTVDLTNLFHINPGFRVGSVFMCGPVEKPGQSNSCLRHFLFDSDLDSNNDGIPNNYGLPWSKVYATGIGSVAPGGTKTAYGGYARTIFAGSFQTSGANKDRFVGDYRLTLGGLLEEPSMWDANGLYLQIQNVATPLIPATYLNSAVTIRNNHYTNQIVNPKEIITNDHRYGFSCVTIQFHVTDGTLYAPHVSASGLFNSAVHGPNFEGQPAFYTVSADAYGTPTSSPGAPYGGVNACLPEGQYTFNADSRVRNTAGTVDSFNTLPPITYYLRPCQWVVVCPGLELSVTNLPLCATQRVINVSGSVNSVTNVTQLFYELNGGLSTICNNCGVSPAFSFPITLDDCDNTLKVTAIDSRGCTSIVETVVKYDVTPPVIAGCKDIYTNSIAGTNGAIIFYPISAVDNCDGPVDVICTPTNGSFFPIGKTVVTCVAVDGCKNTNVCTFNVGIDTCLNIGNERIECEDYHVWTYTFSLTNCFPGEISYVAIPEIFTPGVMLTSDPILYLGEPILPGESRDVTLTFKSPTNAPPPTNFCFLISVHNDNFDLCCSETHWVALPKCCLKIRNPRITCVTNVPGKFTYTFTVQNLSEVIGKYFYIVPTPPPCFTVMPPIITLPLLQPGQSTNVSLMLQNVSPSCGSNLCLIISLHDTNIVQCCGITNCIPNPALPRIICPSNLVAECIGPNGTPVTYSASASGSCFSSNVTLVCSPPSGFPFPLGTTMAKCHAWDNRGYTNWCTFAVTIRDTRPPQIHCPTNIVSNCGTTNGARVAFMVTASDICDRDPIVLCRPPSNSLFPLGTTMVHCRALDDSGNTNACWFNVTVLFDPPPRVISVVADCVSNKVTIIFSEALDPALLLDQFLYLIASPKGGAVINSTSLGSAANSVCLFTSPLQPDTYQLGIYGLSDRCGNPVPEGPYAFICPTNPCVLVETNATWRYWDRGGIAGTAWKDPGFNDSSWTSGPAELGFGDGGEATVLTAGHITYYFRHMFNVANPAAYSSLTVCLMRDDGARVFINGTQVVNDNLPAGSITASTLALAAVNPPQESTFFLFPVSPSVLVAGANVIAVEVHQVNTNSSDISFALGLKCQEAGGPAPLLLIDRMDAGHVELSMSTMPGVICHIEFTDSLESPNWRTLATMVGDGTIHTLTDSSASTSSRFYRIRIE